VDIETLREKVLAGRYQVSMHADIERQREGIAVGDLISCVMSGEVVAEDVDPERGMEYLVEGTMGTKERLRVKLGIDDADEIVFITVYRRKQKRAGGKSSGRGRR
jgi:hypothetical protein